MEAPPLYTAHGPWIAAEPAPCPIKEQGRLAAEGAILNAYIALRIQEEKTWKLRRQNRAQGVGIEDHARLALYRDRLDWLLENYK